MGFNDLPIFDDNAKMSEGSENFVRSQFSSKKGFITRKDEKDFGIDFRMELLNKHGATGFDFTTQVKSAQNLKIVTINKIKFIALSIETSRLGYLCRYSPKFGLIVAYDDTSEMCYYEFVEIAYQRLMEEKGSDNWKSQDSVTIHIPITNIIEINDPLEEIYEHYDILRQNISTMSWNEAPKYNLIHISTTNDVDIKTVGIDLLNDGVDLLRKKEYLLIFQELRKLEFGLIKSNPTLSYIAAITYSETSSLLDAEFFFRNCLTSDFKYSENEMALLTYSNLSNNRRLGRIDHNLFVQGIRNIEGQFSELASISIRIRILNWELVQEPCSKNLFQDHHNKAIMLLEQIDNSSAEEYHKHLARLNCANYIQYIFTRASVCFLELNKTNVEFRNNLSEKEFKKTVEYIRSLADLSSTLSERAHRFSLVNKLDHFKYMILHSLAKETNLLILFSIASKTYTPQVVPDSEIQRYIEFMDEVVEYYKVQGRLYEQYDAQRTKYNLQEIRFKVLGAITESEYNLGTQELISAEKQLGINIRHTTDLDKIL